MNKRIVLFLVSVFVFHSIQYAQNRTVRSNTNGWYMYFGDHKFSDKWGVHLEAQFRRNQVIKNGQQLLLRTGLNYHLSDAAFVTLGYCFVETYPYGAFPVKASFPENRIWQQLQVKNKMGIIEWVSRFRLEQRFSKIPVLNASVYEPGDAVYTNRFRLLNRASIPFKGKSIQDRSLYVSVYDEFFVNFGKHVTANIFDQNRAYLALGYKIPKVGRLELGYMNQLLFKFDGIKVENNHTLQLGILSTIEFRHKHS